MRSKKRISKKKNINPYFWIFCEGLTEKTYIQSLTSEYRIRANIKEYKKGIKDTKIKNYIKHHKGDFIPKKDKIILIYDGDIPNIKNKLQQIQNQDMLIISTPCIELWFLLHYKKYNRELTSKECREELCKKNNHYKKGQINDILTKKLKEGRKAACYRAKKTKLHENPSTNMHELIELFEETKNLNN